MASSLAGFARVAYEATGLADFENDNRRAEAAYRDSTSGMSDAAIKLELSQDKLRRSLAKGPAAFREQARAELAVRNSERALRGETDALTRSQDRQQRGMGGLRRSVIGLAAAYVGVNGIISLIRGSVNAAREEELVLGQTRVALEAAGVSYDEYGGKLERTIAQVRQLGFDDEELAKSFQLLARSADSPAQALDQLNLVADVSRGRYIDLAAATGIVNKANLGMSGALRRIGIDVGKNASATELLAALTRSYGKAAEEAADSGVAAADRFAVATEEAQEAIGRGLAPAITDLSERISVWLEKEENLERLQTRVNQAVEIGETVVRGLARAFDIFNAAIIGPLKSVGLLDEAITAAIGIGLVRKAGLGAVAVKGIGVASALAGRQVAANSALMVGSLNGVTAAAGRAAGATALIGAGGVGGAVGRGGRVRGALGVLGLSPGGAILTGAALMTYYGFKSSRRGALSSNDYQKLREAAGRGEVTWAQFQEMKKFLDDTQEREIRRLIAVANARGVGGPDSRDGARGPGAIAASNAEVAARGGSGGGGGGGRTMGDILLDQARASTTPGTGDDLRLHREAASFVQRQINQLERRKNLNEKQKAQLASLYNDLASEQAAINAIIEEGEAKIEAAEKAAAEKQAAKRKAAAEKAEAQLERHNKAAEAYEERLARAGKGRGGMPLGERQKNQAEQRKKGEAARKKMKDEAAAKGITAEQVRSMQFEFLGMLQGTMNQFGGNLFAGGSLGGSGTPNPDIYMMSGELQKQTQLLAGLASGVRQPGTRYARTELQAAFDGPTF